MVEHAEVAVGSSNSNTESCDGMRGQTTGWPFTFSSGPNLSHHGDRHRHGPKYLSAAGPADASLPAAAQHACIHACMRARGGHKTSTCTSMQLKLDMRTTEQQLNMCACGDRKYVFEMCDENDRI